MSTYTRTVVSVVAIALAAEGVAWSQEGPAAAASSSAKADDAARLVVTAKADEQVELEDENLGRLHGMYDLARNVVGNQHVVVAPVVFAGNRCATGTNVFNCSTPVVGQGGVAGVVIVPLFGFGGNHGVDFWPRVQTDTVGDGFRQFDRSYQRLREAVAGPLGLPPEDLASGAALAKRFQVRAQAFGDLLSRLVDTDAYYYEDIQRLNACLDVLRAGPVITGEPSTNTPAPAQSCADGIARGGQSRGWTIKQKLKYLDDLWKQYDLLVQESPVSRHNLLVGPLGGVSITDKFGDILYGAGLEAGCKKWLRVTAAAGFRSSMHGSVKSANFDTVGLWVGIGLSGQLGDQLIDGILGVHQIFASATRRDP